MPALTRSYWIEAQFERREGWDEGIYPLNLPAVRTLQRLEFHSNVTFLVGGNRSGKSTLIEALSASSVFSTGQYPVLGWLRRLAGDPARLHSKRVIQHNQIRDLAWRNPAALA